MYDFVIKNNVLVKYTGNNPNVYIPHGVEVIACGAFDSCRTARHVEFPDTVRVVEKYAFDKCDMTSVHLNEGLHEIGDCAFRGTYLESVDIPDSVQVIGSQVFMGCEKLKSVTLPSSLACIRAGMFEDCKSLVNIEIPDTVDTIESSAFYGCELLKYVEMPEALINVDSYAFYNCSSLYSVDMPYALINIGDYAFYGCTSLEEINLKDGLQNIGEYAFCGCAFTEIIIPNTVTNFGQDALRKCSKLDDVYCDPNIANLVIPKPFEVHTNYTSNNTYNNLTSYFK